MKIAGFHTLKVPWIVQLMVQKPGMELSYQALQVPAD